jgi:hypothetical protein
MANDSCLFQADCLQVIFKNSIYHKCRKFVLKYTLRIFSNRSANDGMLMFHLLVFHRYVEAAGLSSRRVEEANIGVCILPGTV